VAKDTKAITKETKPAAKETKPVVKETKPAPKENKEEKSLNRNARPNFFNRTIEGVRRYFAETIGELRKVNWPTRREAWYLTGVVLVVTGVMSALLGSFDYLFSKFFEFILKL
jgi:preprotein translocase subunit SecE